MLMAITYNYLSLKKQHRTDLKALTSCSDIPKDAMVVRTDFNAKTRGGAKTSAFRLSDISPEALQHNEKAIPLEEMQRNFKRFLEEVIPLATVGQKKMRSSGSSYDRTGAREAKRDDERPAAELE